MEQVEPMVFHVGQTTIDRVGLGQYLAEIGVPDWITDAGSGAEELTEVMGRECYRSFAPGLNKNVTKIREGNQPYIANILKVKHGSVLEHAVDNYIFLYCSRVFTHEMVRNRGEILGNAFSQESLRYVRLDQLKSWYPSIFADLKRCNPKYSLNEAQDKLMAIWQQTFKTLEDTQVELAELFDLDNMPDFSTKKKLTSAMRRLAPIGLATSIGFSANHRAMRWAIHQRTDGGAEEEMRLIFGKVFDIQSKLYPNLYQDARIEEIDGLRQISFENYKV
jgi:thymidylate synthase (FAD)